MAKSRGRTKVQEGSRIDIYGKKRKVPSHTKTFNGEEFYYNYIEYGKRNAASKAKILRRNGYKYRIEYIGSGQYIIWQRKY